MVPPQRVTYADLARRVLDLARDLFGLGVGRGTPVGILMPNRIEWIEAYLATALLGAVSVPMNTRYQTDETAHLIAHPELAVVITAGDGHVGSELTELLRRVVGNLPSDGTPISDPNFPALRHFVDLGATPASGFLGRGDLHGAGRAASTGDVVELALSVVLDDVASILYTSGTTARPKGCVMSYRALVRTAVARLVERRLDQDRFVVWTPCPLFHGGALVPLIGCIATASTYVTSQRFDAGEALGLIESEQVTNALPLFPAFTDALLDDARFAETDLSTLRDVLTIGPPRGLVRAQQAFAPAKLMSAYGCTELCAVATGSAVDEPDDERLIWAGRPFDGIEIKVVDPGTGEDRPRGEIGELVARGYCLFDGYHRDPQATAAAIDEDGWFHTGDMGVADAAGRVAFRGRYKDMLKVGGENVAAMEVERFLAGHPAVRHAEVVGAPDLRLHEVVAAYVELEPGCTASAAQIIEFCTGRIAKYKVPRHVRFVGSDDWPMSATKVDKNALRKRIRAEVVSDLTGREEVRPPGS